jgi:hypothetical protein
MKVGGDTRKTRTDLQGETLRFSWQPAGP